MNGRVFYNEIDPFAAAWLRELIADGLVPAGDVDERDIRDIRPGDLDGYYQCHFFCGIAGWSEALRLAGLADTPGIWTGSCPCQPFSAAGRGGGFADERHLWPAFFHLIEQCRPAFVVGEQVSGAAGLGWLDLVCDDLEGCGYAVRAEARPACSVGAPHKRERLWWMAYTPGGRGHNTPRLDETRQKRPADAQPDDARQHAQRFGGRGGIERLADSIGSRLERCDARALGHEREAAERGGAAGELGDAALHGAGAGRQPQQSTSSGRPEPGRSGPWDDIEWLPCRDGKARPAQPGIQPLAHGVRNRVGALRGAGNSIVPQVGASFVSDFLAETHHV